MATQLSLYNDALLFCGERFLASLTENREPRRLLDQVWAQGGVKACLERGEWNFATRTIQIDYDPSIQPSFGLANAFQKPTDWVRTAGLCSDPFFRVPLLQYTDEGGFWFADLQTLYVRHISNDNNYGMNLAAWPESFREYVACHFATKIVLKLSNSQAMYEGLLKEEDRLLEKAKGDSARDKPTKFPAQGAWSRARTRYASRRDGGNTTGNLTG